MHAARLRRARASEERDCSPVPRPWVVGGKHLQPSRNVPAELRLLEAHCERAGVTQAFHSADNFRPSIAQIDRPVEHQRPGRRIHRVDPLASDGAERERLAEPAIVLDPLDAHFRREPVATQCAVLDTQARTSQGIVPCRRGGRIAGDKQRHARDGLGHARTLPEAPSLPVRPPCRRGSASVVDEHMTASLFTARNTHRAASKKKAPRRQNRRRRHLLAMRGESLSLDHSKSWHRRWTKGDLPLRDPFGAAPASALPMLSPTATADPPTRQCTADATGTLKMTSHVKRNRIDTLGNPFPARQEAASLRVQLE